MRDARMDGWGVMEHEPEGARPILSRSSTSTSLLHKHCLLISSSLLFSSLSSGHSAGQHQLLPELQLSINSLTK